MKIKFLALVALVCAFVFKLSAQTYFVEAEGIGPVKIGQDYRNLPESVPGLYDKVAIVEEYNAMEDYNEIICTFTLNGNDRFYAYANEEGDIWSVMPATTDLRTKSGVYDGMPAREFIKLPGVKVVFNPEADYNHVSFEIDGVAVGVDEYFYSSTGTQKIQKALRSKVAPTFVASDFASDAVIVLGGFNY